MQGRKMLQAWAQQATSDAIGRAVDSGADLYATRQAAYVGNGYGYGGYGGGGWWKKH